MKRWKLLTGILAIVAFIGLGYTLAMSGACPQKLTIKDPAFGRLHKKGVTFNHALHGKEFGCVKCHHTYPNDAAVKKGPVKKCSECHKAVREPISVRGCERKYSGGKAPGLKCAFHMNCWGCHEKLKKEGKPTGPTSCGKCHNTK